MHDLVPDFRVVHFHRAAVTQDSGVVEKAIELAEVVFQSHRQFFVDRKSTRLNSSHVRISYAVFCLKKKKKQYYDITLQSSIADDIMTHFTTTIEVIPLSLVVSG